ncbi:hypothetical protein ACTJKO_14395 [Curtobacterium sp. 22159]|uniref:hypothetical protein n=1 Tax=Curtobacterium sp. 22159 TaxID=3453882 RepID=UPI003F8592AF
MRVLLYLLMILITTTLCLGAGLLVGLTFGGAPRGILVAAAVASPFLVVVPVVVGAFAAYWDPRSSTEARRYLGWWFLGAAAVDVVAAAVVVTAALAAQAPAWVPVLLVGGAAVLLAVARPLGTLFRRTEPPVVGPADAVLPDAQVIRRKVRAIAVTFVVSAAVATIGVALLAVLDDGHGSVPTQAVFLAGQLTFTATALATVIVSLPFSHALRDTGGRDIGRLRRFGRVVLRGKALPLDDADERAALQYARLIPLVLQFQLVFTGLLYVAIAFQFVSSAVRGELGLLPAVTLPALAVVLLVVVPLTVRRIRRAQAYVGSHDGAQRDVQSAEARAV